MKFLAAFALLVCAAYGAPALTEWTQAQLSQALNDPKTDPKLLPYLEHAFNQMMDALWAGHPMASIPVLLPAELLVQPDPVIITPVLPSPSISTEWTQAQLSEALNDPATDPALLPILEQAFNQMIQALWDGGSMETITVLIPMELLLKPQPEVPAETPVLPSPAISSEWTLAELSHAIQDPSTDPLLIPYLEQALNQMMDALFSGHAMETITVSIPSDLLVKPEPEVPVAPVVVPELAAVSEWSLAQLSHALQDPSTDPILIPYLEHALNQMMDAIFAGHAMETITVVVPELMDKPVPGEAVDAAPAPAPVPAPAPSPASAPLVQIILNINQKAQDAPVAGSPAVVPEVVPEEVHVVEDAYESITIDKPIIDTNPIEEIAISPPEVNPIEEIAISPPEVNPIEVIAISPPEVNPIDVIAVSPAEVNPVDIIAPLPVVQPAEGADGIIV